MRDLVGSVAVSAGSFPVYDTVFRRNVCVGLERSAGVLSAVRVRSAYAPVVAPPSWNLQQRVQERHLLTVQLVGSVLAECVDCTRTGVNGLGPSALALVGLQRAARCSGPKGSCTVGSRVRGSRRSRPGRCSWPGFAVISRLRPRRSMGRANARAARV